MHYTTVIRSVSQHGKCKALNIVMFLTASKPRTVAREACSAQQEINSAKLPWDVPNMSSSFTRRLMDQWHAVQENEGKMVKGSRAKVMGANSLHFVIYHYDGHRLIAVISNTLLMSYLIWAQLHLCLSELAHASMLLHLELAHTALKFEDKWSLHKGVVNAESDSRNRDTGLSMQPGIMTTSGWPSYQYLSYCWNAWPCT